MINRICNESFLHPAYKHQKLKWKSAAWYLSIFAIALILVGNSVSCDEKIIKVEPAVKIEPSREVQMTEYFKSKGSPVPQKMAKAVLSTKNPKLMASIAVHESNGNPKAVGDGGKSKGAFQVQSHHHGRVSKNPIKQALQSERILEELLAENNGNLKKALSAYNGERTRKVYANKILAELTQIP